MISSCAELPLNYVECFPQERVTIANQLFNNMLKINISPNVVSFGALLNVYAKSGNWESAEKLITELMPEHGLQSNVVTSTTLINAYNRKGQFEKSVEYFQKVSSYFNINQPL